MLFQIQKVTILCFIQIMEQICSVMLQRISLDISQITHAVNLTEV